MTIATAPATKSVRLSPDEARELEEYIEFTNDVEARVLRRAFVAGLRRERITRGIALFLDTDDLAQGARLAGVSAERFEAELRRRAIPMRQAWEDPQFTSDYQALRDRLNDSIAADPAERKRRARTTENVARA